METGLVLLTHVIINAVCVCVFDVLCVCLMYCVCVLSDVCVCACVCVYSLAIRIYACIYACVGLCAVLMEHASTLGGLVASAGHSTGNTEDMYVLYDTCVLIF